MRIKVFIVFLKLIFLFNGFDFNVEMLIDDSLKEVLRVFFEKGI